MTQSNTLPDSRLKVKGRFAPSPSGEIHAGNIFSSLVAWLIAHMQGGTMVMRIEDLDPSRSKKAYADKILFDYERLGLFWDEGPYYQSDQNVYEQAYACLQKRGLLYPCFCTRADLRASSAPHAGEKAVYSGRCRAYSDEMRRRLQLDHRYAWRVLTTHSTVSFNDGFQGYQSFDLAGECGDFIVRRSDGVFAYQLAVVVDDARFNVNSVVRGYDLLDSTPQQLYLHDLLGLPAPHYAHVPLFVDAEGRRLSKRHKDAELDALIDQYGSPEAVIGAIAHCAGLIESFHPVRPVDLVAELTIEQVSAALRDKKTIVWETECERR